MNVGAKGHIVYNEHAFFNAILIQQRVSDTMQLPSTCLLGAGCWFRKRIKPSWQWKKQVQSILYQVHFIFWYSHPNKVGTSNHLKNKVNSHLTSHWHSNPVTKMARLNSTKNYPVGPFGRKKMDKGWTTGLSFVTHSMRVGSMEGLDLGKPPRRLASHHQDLYICSEIPS